MYVCLGQLFVFIFVLMDVLFFILLLSFCCHYQCSRLYEKAHLRNDFSNVLSGM